MTITSIRRMAVPAIAALALAAGMSACGASNESAGGSNGGSKTLNGGGSTAQAKAEGAWRADFQKANSGTTVNYEEVGSGTGRENFISKAYDYAGSDAYLTDDAGDLTKAKTRCNGEDPIEVPAYVSPIAVAFNLKGVDSLNLSAENVAKIFNGTITTWNDPAIVADNKGVSLPSTSIATIHRSDDSGTTQNFTEYLSGAGNGAWTDDPSQTWPTDAKGGQGLEGTAGVVGGITDTDGAIGYIDSSAVGNLSVAKIKVGSQWVAPSAAAAAKVVALSPVESGRPAVDMAITVDRTTTVKGAYPLVLISYLIACQHYDDSTTADLVKKFLTYTVSSQGQQSAATAAGSAPLDSTVADKATAIVEKIAATK